MQESDDLQMEHGFLKAPWELLMRSFRTGHKSVIKDAESLSTAVLKTLDDVMRTASDGTTHVPADRLESLIGQLVALQHRLETARLADRRGLDACLARIEHLQQRTIPGFDARRRGKSKVDVKEVDVKDVDLMETDTPDNASSPIVSPTDGRTHSKESVLRWEKTRLDRVLVDYMMREGMYESASKLAHSERIESLVDTTIFKEARKVIQALRQRDCSEALKWCNDNKRRLMKTQSTLEFQLRCQEYIEYARAGNKMMAISYARKWLTVGSNTKERQDDIKRYMGLLAFPANTPCQPYKDMYSHEKWADLEENFKQENYKMHGLTSESTLEILLKTGLASLKTRKCGSDHDRKPNCPTCNEPYLTLSEDLPHSQHVNSILVCSISGEIMDENNPPMALPNGNVYSYNALQDIAARNDGTIVDPKSQKECRFTQLKKCYIM